MKIDETEDVSYPEDSLVLTKPVHISGELVNTGRIIVLKGTVDTSVRQICGRCLKEFEFPLSFQVEEEYVRGQGYQESEEDETGKGEKELTDDDFVFEVESNNTINVSEAIRQNLITELPIKPLCDEKCPDIESG